jgi:NaMN:DMB phosphoribosyltransferase
VKEGVGAGAAAIAAHLYQNWDNDTLVKQIENLLDTSHKINS